MTVFIRTVGLCLLLSIMPARAELIKIFEDSFDYEHTFWDGNYVTVGTTGWHSVLHPKTAATIDAGITTTGALTFVIPVGKKAAAEGGEYTVPQLFIPVTGNFEAIVKVHKPWENENWDNYGVFCSYPDGSINHIHAYTFPVLSMNRMALRFTRNGSSQHYESMGSAHQWVKLVRVGNEFSVYSREGDTNAWQQRVSPKTYNNAPTVLNVGPYAANYVTDGLTAGYDLFELWQDLSAYLTVSETSVKRQLVFDENAIFSLTVNNTGNQDTGLDVSIGNTSWLNPLGAAPTNLAAGQSEVIAFEISTAGMTTPQVLTNTITFNNQGDAQPACTVIIDVDAVRMNALRQLRPSTHRTVLIISEIMYHPADRADGLDLEYVELFNTEPVAQDVSGFRLDGEIRYAFPEGAHIPARGFLVVAKDPAAIETVYGLAGAYGPYDGSLNNAGGPLRLLNKRGAVFLDVNYNDRYPWPIAADGTGHSLVQAQPDYGEGDVRAWTVSGTVGGNPGMVNSISNSAQNALIINELLSASSTGQAAFIELYNRGEETIDLSGYHLSHDPLSPAFTIPGSTTILPGGFVTFTTADWSQAALMTEPAGKVYLLDASRNCVIDAVSYQACDAGVSQGHYPDGAYGVYALESRTPGSANSPLYSFDIVINEIMYHPISDTGDDEYIELYNRGTQPVDISGWRVSGGIGYIFPNGTVIPADDYLVIGRNTQHLIAQYQHLSAANTVGNFDQRLNNSGERILLQQPMLAGTNDEGYVTIDAVTYGDGGTWGKWADGNGSSLELMNPDSDNRFADNWAGSDEADKSEWTTVSFTGKLDLGQLNCDRLELLLLDSGECLVDDIAITKEGETQNRVNNGDFASGNSGWQISGNHIDSSVVDNAGPDGSRAMHIIASGDGDNQVNCLRKYLTSNLELNETATIAFKVRWLGGSRNLLLRLHGNYLEAVGLMDVPVEAGTPGLINSRDTLNTGPAVEQVQHAPILPAASEPVTVTAMVLDQDGIGNVTLYYRIDPNLSYTTLPMNDAGTAGDGVAGDAIYSATIPGQSSGKLAAFYIYATDAHGTPAHTVFPPSAPGKEALVRFGEEKPDNEFNFYTMWVTEENSNHWLNIPKLSNELIDGTFVYGQHRAVYTAGIRMRGSSWIRYRFGNPFSFFAAYMIKVAKSDRIMGDTSFNMDNLSQQDVWGRGVLDPTFLRERMSYWIGEKLGVPTPGQQYVLLYLNGQRKGEVYIDTQYPNGDYLESWYPYDGNGHNYEADDWFEYEGSPISLQAATLENFTTTGGEKKQARYRWRWEKKVRNAADDDYAPIYELVDAMNASSNYFDTVAAVVDWEEWMRGIAVRRGVADRDGYGFERGKNAYIYRGLRTKWQYFVWDLDLGMGIERPYNHELFSEIGDPVLANKFFREPAFRRAYMRAMQEIADGPMSAGQFIPRVEDYYQALNNNDIDARDLNEFKDWVSARRGYIASSLAQYDIPFNILSPDSGKFVYSTPLIVTGTAPIKVDAITVNGYQYPVSWYTVTNWVISVGLYPGNNQLDFQGYDSSGRILAGMTDSVSAWYLCATNVHPGSVVINEIMYHPPEGNAEFIELYNPSPHYPVALSNYRMDGVQAVFDENVFLGPGEYGVIVEDMNDFSQVYGPGISILGEYDGRLDNGGERIALYRMDPETVGPVTGDEVTYSDDPPWATAADGLGPSLQLIDPQHDNSRVANWATSEAPLYTPGQENAVYAPLPSFPRVTVNEVLVENVAGITDGHGDHDPWCEILNTGTDTISLSNYFLTDELDNLIKWPFPGNVAITGGTFTLVWLDGEPEQSLGSELHTSFRIQPGTGCVALVHMQAGTPYILDYLRYYPDTADTSRGSYPDGDSNRRHRFILPTPGMPNNGTQPPVPVVINEWMADNDSFIPDPADGDYEDWFELFNMSTQAVDLSGCILTDGDARFTIPQGTQIDGQDFILVWADNDTNQNILGGDLHVNFKLSRNGEEIHLLRETYTLDRIMFGPQLMDISEGRWTDGEYTRQTMEPPTPGMPNEIPEPGGVVWAGMVVAYCIMRGKQKLQKGVQKSEY